MNMPMLCVEKARYVGKETYQAGASAHGVGMTEAQEAVSKAIRRNLGTVRTFSCPEPATCPLPPSHSCCAV